MPFSISEYIRSGFQLPDDSPEAIKEAAQTILANRDVFSGLGQMEPVDWARMALEFITDDYVRKSRPDEKEEALGLARSWITGSKRPTARQGVLKTYRENMADVQKKVNELQANIANIRDNPAEANTEQGKANIARYQKELENITPVAQAVGIQVQAPVRQASGFVPAGEELPDRRIEEEGGAIPAERSGRIPTLIRALDAQGQEVRPEMDQSKIVSFQILDSRTQAPLETISVGANGIDVARTQALSRQNQITVGSTPQLTDQPTIFSAPPITDSERQAVTSGQATVATPEQIETAQAVGETRQEASPFDSLVGEAEARVGAKEEAETSINPNLTVTPEMRAEWLAEAMDELKENRYYQEVIRNAEFDLGISINRLIQSTRQRELNIVQDFKENLEATEKSLQERGMLFQAKGGGVRAGEERTLADKTNLQLLGEEAQFTQGLQDISRTGERYFGTDFAQTLTPKYGTVEQVGRVLPGSPVFQTGERLQAFSPLGGQFGSLPREIRTEALTRAGEKEIAYRGRDFTLPELEEYRQRFTSQLR